MPDTVRFQYAEENIVFNLYPAGEYISDLIRKQKSFYERDVLEDIVRFPLGEGAIVDVGANIGNHSIYFAKILKRHVFAVEPVDKNYELLLANIRDNGCEDVITPHKYALLDVRQQGSMSCADHNSGIAKFLATNDGQVESVTLDSLIQDNKVSLIKIDVEGAEVKVLNGARETILRDRPIILAEAHNDVAYLNLMNVVQGLGYFPAGYKGRTRTYTFIHKDYVAEHKNLGSFVIRTDIEALHKSLRETNDRLMHELKNLSASTKDLTQKVLEGYRDTLAAEIEGVRSLITAIDVPSLDDYGRAIERRDGQMAERITRISENISSQIDSLHQNLYHNAKNICDHADNIANKHMAYADTMSVNVQRALHSFEGNLSEALATNLSKSEQQISARLKSAEGTLADIKQSIQNIIVAKPNDGGQATTKAEQQIRALRAQLIEEKQAVSFLTRRLKHLYNTGPRRNWGYVKKALSVVTRGRIKAYESWEEFEERKNSIVKAGPLNTPAYNDRYPVLPVPAYHNTADVDCNVRTDHVRIGIASIKIRVSALEMVINSLYHQADEFIVYLNDYTDIPEFLKRPKIKCIIGQGDVGDRGKFYGIDDYKGYMLTCDDDIIYPSYYVRHCIDGIERYDRKAVVGWHGSCLKEDFDDYYSASSRRVFSFRSGRPEDQPVHILGTGCTAFHTDTISIRYDEFKRPNMADVYFAVHGQDNKIPFVVLKHNANEAYPLEIENDIAIHKESMKETGSKADTKEEQNRLVKEKWPWTLHRAEPLFERRTFNISYIGRIDVERWRKGGILKSGNMLISAMRSLGNNVSAVDISKPFDVLMDSVVQSQIVWIYPGDPERPDFADVEKIINEAAKLGKRVYVNLSYNTDESRSAWIRSKLVTWRDLYGDKIKACVFTNSALNDPAFIDVRSNLICIPKSIDYDCGCDAEFNKTEGIFLGDLQKLLNLKLTRDPIENWIEALRKVLPGVKLYCVRQYGGQVDRDIGVETAPYMVGDVWNEWLSSRRIACCLTPVTTYEMVQMEAAGMGVPVIYRNMPQSHTECLSVSGVQVDTPEEFARACAALYHDSTIWEMYSRSARLRAQSQHIDYIKAAIHTQIMLKS